MNVSYRLQSDAYSYNPGLLTTITAELSVSEPPTLNNSYSNVVSMIASMMWSA